MKIIAGTYKNRNFYTHRDIRPTQNLVRKALFDILGQFLEGVTFLDLFAGSGSVGLEAISRDAEHVVLVEKDPVIFKMLSENVSLLMTPLEESFELVEADALMTIKNFARAGRKFDIVFLDPPYGRELAKKALKTISSYDILQPNCTLVIQHVKRERLPSSQGRFLLYRQKTFGSTILSFYKNN